MLSRESAVVSAHLATIIAAALAFLGTIVVGALSFFAARGSATAAQQTALNQSFSGLVQELQEERSVLVAHVSSLESRLEQLSGDLANSQQFALSLSQLLRRQGIEVPQNKYLPVSMIVIEDQSDANPTQEG